MMQGVTAAPSQTALPLKSGEAAFTRQSNHSSQSKSSTASSSTSGTGTAQGTASSASISHAHAPKVAKQTLHHGQAIGVSHAVPQTPVPISAPAAANSQTTQATQVGQGQFSLQQGALSVDALVNVSPDNRATNNGDETTPRADSSSAPSVAAGETNPASDNQSSERAGEGEPRQAPPSVEDESQQAGAEEAGTNTEEDKSSDDQQAVKEQQAQQELQALAKRDAEVRAHEQAHANVGGQYAGSPSYSYEQGSDGKRYAVDGEVQIDITPIANDPQATVNKMQKVYAAAMAPVQPSMADIQVANEAMRNLNSAKADLASERSEQFAGDNNQTPPIFSSGNGQQARVNPFENEGSRFQPETDADGNISYVARDEQNNAVATSIDSINTQVTQQSQTQQERVEIQQVNLDVLQSKYNPQQASSSSIDFRV
ncbi:putative metalloprotease CJM1_0395 family protein [Shewanella waksmanii]|uniref:putative metalloprotease CJM1_0395 family protein n=1 Tax=Shewanella waksmanii TaxID=213783 RepID=UPI000686DFBD|nr:putative metalloprotease CJM1_0395 family protein [Shewanella waksmanii]